MPAIVAPSPTRWKRNFTGKPVSPLTPLAVPER